MLRRSCVPFVVVDVAVVLVVAGRSSCSGCRLDGWRNLPHHRPGKKHLSKGGGMVSASPIGIVPCGSVEVVLEL